MKGGGGRAYLCEADISVNTNLACEAQILVLRRTVGRDWVSAEVGFRGGLALSSFDAWCLR